MRASFIALLAACALVAVSAHSHNYKKWHHHKAEPSCLSIAEKYCPTFAMTIVEQTPELAKFLNDSSSIVTFFCPTDDALPDAEIPDGTTIQEVLYYHVSDYAAYQAKQLVKASPINTILWNHSLSVEEECKDKKTKYYVQSDLSVALVTKANLKCGKGIIHLIDTVLIPDITMTSETYVEPCKTSPPPVHYANPPCKWSWHAPAPPSTPVSMASPPCKWSWKTSPPPACSPKPHVQNSPPTCYSPPACPQTPVKVYSPPACPQTPVKVYSPPACPNSPPPCHPNNPPPCHPNNPPPCHPNNPPPCHPNNPPPCHPNNPPPCHPNNPPPCHPNNPPPCQPNSPPPCHPNSPAYCAPPAHTTCPSIYAQISADANLSTLKMLIDIAGLQGALSDSSLVFTVFAPSNAALQNMGVAAMCADKDNLIKTLKNHIAPGVAVFKEQFSEGICMQTLCDAKPVCASITGYSVVIRAQGQNACSSIINRYNVQACNSVIHTIDNVLVPYY